MSLAAFARAVNNANGYLPQLWTIVCMCVGYTVIVGTILSGTAIRMVVCSVWATIIVIVGQYLLEMPA